MTEVLTKNFWKDVKKTFQDALEGDAPAEKGDRNISSAPESDKIDSHTPQGAMAPSRSHAATANGRTNACRALPIFGSGAS
jgi:hypothetical protein